MAVRIIQLGTARTLGEGSRIGTVRRPPRGVRKADFAAKNYFDIWLPELAPSTPVVKWALSEPWTPKRWAMYKRKYLREMADPAARRQIDLLAALSAQTNFSVGCYCVDAAHCHRSILKELLLTQGADVI